MLCGDYYSYATCSAQSGGSGYCRLCGFISHILNCPITVRAKMNTLENLAIAIKGTTILIDFESLKESEHFDQFILDCTSLNLPNNYRVNIRDTAVIDIFKSARKTVHAIQSEQLRQLKNLEKKNM